jgi:hypothetical protein
MGKVKTITKSNFKVNYLAELPTEIIEKIYCINHKELMGDMFEGRPFILAQKVASSEIRFASRIRQQNGMRCGIYYNNDACINPENYESLNIKPSDIQYFERTQLAHSKHVHPYNIHRKSGIQCKMRFIIRNLA